MEIKIKEEPEDKSYEDMTRKEKSAYNLKQQENAMKGFLLSLLIIPVGFFLMWLSS